MSDMVLHTEWREPQQAHSSLKTCTCCNVGKPTTEYHKDKQKKSGLCAICKDCNRAKALAWANENVKKNRARSAEWKKQNPERARIKDAEWRKNNPERKKKKDAEWRSANPELCKLHSLNRRAREAKADGTPSKGLTEKLFKLQNGLCPCCKKPLGNDFHLDHIIPLVMGGRNDDGNMQLLRKTCNLQKNRKDPVAFMQERGFLL